MIDIAAARDDIDGDILLNDMGQGLPFRPGTFDGAISISALQWLCNADKKINNPVKRINTFFAKLYAFYPNRLSCESFKFHPLSLVFDLCFVVVDMLHYGEVPGRCCKRTRRTRSKWTFSQLPHFDQVLVEVGSLTIPTLLVLRNSTLSSGLERPRSRVRGMRRLSHWTVKNQVR